MINYKSFKLPGNAKLRIRTDNIVATASSKLNGTVDIFVSGVANPWHVKFENEDELKKTMDYIWERHSKEEDD